LLALFGCWHVPRSISNSAVWCGCGADCKKTCRGCHDGELREEDRQYGAQSLFAYVHCILHVCSDTFPTAKIGRSTTAYTGDRHTYAWTCERQVQMIKPCVNAAHPRVGARIQPRPNRYRTRCSVRPHDIQARTHNTKHECNSRSSKRPLGLSRPSIATNHR